MDMQNKNADKDLIKLRSMEEPSRKLIDLVLNDPNNELVKLPIEEKVKMLVNQLVMRNIQTESVKTIDGIKISKDTDILHSFGLVTWNGHGAGAFQVLTKLPKKTGQVVNGKEVVEMQKIGPNQPIEWSLFSVATKKFGLTDIVPPQYLMKDGEKVMVDGKPVITNPDTVGHKQIGSITIDVTPTKHTDLRGTKGGKDLDKYFHLDGRKNYFTREQLESIFGPLTAKKEMVWLENKYGKVVQKEVTRALLDSKGVTVATTGERGGDSLWMPKTTAAVLDDWDRVVEPTVILKDTCIWYTISIHDLSVESMAKYMEKAYDGFMVHKKVLKDYPYLSAKNRNSQSEWKLFFAHPNWIVNGNQLNMLISCHDLEEKFFKPCGLSSLSTAKKNEMLIRLGKDLLSGSLSKWFKKRIRIYKDKYWNNDPDVPCNDGSLYLNPDDILTNGVFGLFRGYGKLDTIVPYVEGMEYDGWANETFILKWLHKDIKEQKICGAKGRVIVHSDMASYDAYPEDSDSYILELYFYISRNECKDRSKNDYKQNHQFKIQGNFDKTGYLHQFVTRTVEGPVQPGETFPMKRVFRGDQIKYIEFYEKPRDKALQKAMDLANDMNGSVEQRAPRLVNLMNTMDKVWEENEGIVNNSMKAKTFMGLLTEREVPKQEHNIFLSIKSWDVENAIWAGIAFTPFVRLKDTTIELKETQVLISKSMDKRIDDIAEMLKINRSDAFFTIIGYPITTAHSFVTIDIVGVDSTVIGDFIFAHPLIGKLMQRDNDDFVQLTVGLRSLSEISANVESAFDKTPAKEDPAKLTPWIAYYLGRWFQDHIGPIANMLYRVQGALQELYSGEELEFRMMIAEVILGKNLHCFAQGAKKYILPGVTVEELERRLNSRQIAILGFDLAKISELSRSIDGMRKIAELITTDKPGEMHNLYYSDVAKLICPPKGNGKYVRLENFRDSFISQFSHLQNVNLPYAIETDPAGCESTLANWELDPIEEQIYKACKSYTYKNIGKTAHRKIVDYLLVTIVRSATGKKIDKSKVLEEFTTWNDENWVRASGITFSAVRVYTKLAYEYYYRTVTWEPTVEDELFAEAINAGVVLLASLIPAKYMTGAEALEYYKQNVKTPRVLDFVENAYVSPILLDTVYAPVEPQVLDSVLDVYRTEE